MLNLKNMTFQNYLDLFDVFCTFEEKSEIDRLHIVTLEDIENFINCNSDSLPHFILDYYNYIKKEIARIENKYVYEPDNILFSDLSSIDSEDLKVTDKNTLVQDLIISSIVCGSWNVSFLAVEKMTIENIRLLFQYKYKDQLLISNFKNMGKKNIETLLKGLNFYEAQILRQSKIEHTPGTDLFAMDRDKKRQIVEEEVLSYIDYIETCANVCIWGKITDPQKKLMHQAFLNDKELNVSNRERIINTFTNYLTLPELEAGVVKNRTLDRFIIR